jgi:hypothetical protein
MENRRASTWKRPTLVAFMALALVISAPRQGAGAPPSKPPANISVTTYISDTDTAGNPSDIASDGQGAYPNGTNGVTSILTTNGYNGIVWGDWQFSTYASTVRTVKHTLDMTEAIVPGDPHYTAPANPPFLGTQSLTSKNEVKCTLLNHDMLTMSAGSSFTCPMINKFNFSGTDYSLDPAFSFTGYAETTDVSVKCNTADSGGCNDWFIDPIAVGQAVGRLTAPAKHGEVNDGDFYLKFHIHVTRP